MATPAPESKGDFVHLPEPSKAKPPLRSSSFTVANLITFLTSVHGRDKFFRLMQYACKEAALLVAQSNPAGEANGVSDACNKIAGGLVAGRRFLRIGSVFGSTQGVLQALSEPDPLLRFSLAGSRAAALAFLILDNTSWTSRHSLFRMDYQYWGVYEARLWLISLLLALLANVRQLYQVYAKELQLRVQYNLAQAGQDKGPIIDEMRQQDLRRRGVLLDLYRNALDVPLAINALSPTPRFSSLFLSTVALISSFIGCVQSWPTTAPK